MQPDNEDDVWRSIVENYGDRAEVDRTEVDLPPPVAPAWHDAGDEPGEPDEAPAAWDDDQFVPPAPPPLPRVEPDRLVAWIGLFGSPALLLTALVLGLHLPSWIGYLLIAWFIGGFLYLVVKMPSGPRDPGDDGARL
ncbi:MAG: hypothetical protein JWN22_1995 [Nocardioides sp.]|nr:hypothetical protein [Nocardioides sp.]